jgi:hypothetical protein
MAGIKRPRFSATRVIKTIKEICAASQYYPPSLDQFQLAGDELRKYLDLSFARLHIYESKIKQCDYKTQWRMFTYNGQAAFNSFAFPKQGIRANSVLFIAHHDYCAGLGAEDNATSLALMAELARQCTNCRICFASFDLEEPGYKGSAHFVANLSEQEHSMIKIVIDLECLGSGKDLVIANQVGKAISDDELVLDLHAIAKQRGYKFSSASFPCFFADHIPFWQAGFKTAQVTSCDLDHVVTPDMLRAELAFLQAGGVREGGSVVHSKNDLPRFIKKQNLKQIGDVLVEFVKTHFSA